MVFAVFKVTKQTAAQFGDRISPTKSVSQEIRMPILQVFFLKDLQDLALNLASLVYT